MCNSKTLLSKMKTLIVVILDESGSMASKINDVIGGFNSFVDEQKNIKEDEATFYMIKFNTITNVVHDGIPIKDVPHLSTESFRPGGGTALYDAIAEGVRIGEKGKKVGERVICVIMTDGEENSSRETTKEQVKTLISGNEAKGDWTFLYIGENPERWSQDTGMLGHRGMAYSHSMQANNFMAANVAVSNFRAQPMAQAPQSQNLYQVSDPK